ncbi:MFS general substrate transporter [Aspergillus sclerotioniger CBS 115572]|uniref:MFS general substrate transporter n=1 Tax=Aspergillus sclerotioniger CBS 115572 TaxID=1450535 RepID=A0A317V1W9_9EURO|nr:MFS general substrate transporter [Aspergillus sclerotioniger CBS 115572]PWY67639.1 MFS general substrate transporter [Aspergillus sclerotioniger CBS 115572]
MDPRDEKKSELVVAPHGDSQIDEDPLALPEKTWWERSWPTFACGAGLWSDGYLQYVIGTVNTILGKLYPDVYKGSTYSQNVSSIAFAGTVVGMLFFGYLSDHWSRANTLMVSTVILFVFGALCAGAYGAGGSLTGMFTALTAYRFFLGLGVGGEYPAGSVAAAESSGELEEGTRHRWFILFTNFQLDLASVASSLVPMIVVLACGENHLRAAWRICLGLGVIPPLSLIYLRMKLKEPAEYSREKMHKFPAWLIIKFYWQRWCVVALIWFIYDFSTYSFSIYSSAWLSVIIGDNAPLWKTLGWNTLINVFYVPGSFLGAFMSDWYGPRNTLAFGVFVQGAIGFIMTGCYPYLDTSHYVAAFVVVYGIFLAMGEVGPGDNIGLCAAKTCATPIRGQYYGTAAAMGKIGAFVGTYVFPVIVDDAGSNVAHQGQYPFYVSSSLCIFSAFLAYFGLPKINQDTITHEDARFRDYLESQGYDTSTMGIAAPETQEAR